MLRVGPCSFRAGVVAALALGLTGTVVAAAWATYPGRNGRIVLLNHYGGRYMQQKYSLELIDPQGRADDSFTICSAPDRLEGPPYCDRVGPIYLSRDGTKAAMVVFEQAGTTTPSALFNASLTGGPILRLPVSMSEPWLGIGWDADGSPRLARRPASNDPRQTAILSTAQEADWSARGRLAFESGPLGEPGLTNIYAGVPAGPFRQMTFRGGQAPSWSPHGRWIAFARNGGVYVVPSVGGRARRIVPPPAYNYFAHRPASPVWSPDGRQIAFYRQGTYGREDPVHTLSLYSVNWKTRKLRRLAPALMTDDSYDDVVFDRPLWQALPHN